MQKVQNKTSALISGGMSATAVIEYLHLWNAVQHVVLGDQHDKLIWSWSPDGRYSARSAYRMLHSGAIAFRGHSLIWRTWAPLRVKIFLWLTFKRKHWTADRRARHGLPATDAYYLCDQEAETIDHLIIRCPFTREIWHFVLQVVGLQLPPGAHTTIAWWRRVRRLADGPRRKGLDSLFALVSWQVWKERNARCFRNAATTVPEMLQLIKIEADLWIKAGAPGLKALAEQA